MLQYLFPAALIHDVVVIATTLRRKADTRTRWSLVRITHGTGLRRYSRLCEHCIEKYYESVEVLTSDRGKKRAVFHCQECGANAPKQRS